MSNKSSRTRANARAIRRADLAGNRQRYKLGQTQPSGLPFGDYGELTPQTIKAAGLTGEARSRAYEMMDAQQAMLSLLDCMSYPIGPDHTTHDLSALGPTRDAIAWTLALCGFRQTGKVYIKKRKINATGIYADAHTWVDIRDPDDAQDELRPEHKQSDENLPPDTRRLAAVRDGVKPLKMPDGFKVKPEIIFVDEPRPEQAEGGQQ